MRATRSLPTAARRGATARLALALAGFAVTMAAFAVAATPAHAAASRAVTAVRAAHAAVVATYPADGSVLASPPAEVTVTFDEPVVMTPSSLAVYTPNGNRADTGTTTLGAPYEIQVSLLGGLGNGTYTATWHVVSDDTHPVSGAFTFSVGAPSATSVPALSVSGDWLVSAAFTVARWLEYGCFALLCGSVAFLIACWPDGARRRGVARLVTLSWAGLLVSTLLGLLLQGPYAANAGLGSLLDPSLLRSTLNSRLGTASQARELMAFLAGVAASLLLPRLPSLRRRGLVVAGIGWAVLSTSVAASWAVYDHASTGVQAASGLPVAIVHLDAMALWIGGLAVLAGFALRRPGEPGVAAAVPRFSAMALACVTAIVASGAYQTWREVGEWGALTGTPYGRLVLAKMAGLVALIALGYLARRVIRRARPELDWTRAMLRLRLSVAAELLVAAAILALSALLVNTATGREAYAPTVTASQPFDTGAPGGTGVAHVFVGPARLGPNTVEVYLTAVRGSSIAPAAVTADLFFPARHIGPVPVTLTRTGTGQYRALNVVFAFTGQWTLRITVRGDAFDETSVWFPVAVH
jgi:copper transport protein